MDIPRELLHPELRDKSAFWMSMRTDFPLRYMYPHSERVLFYGDLMIYSNLPLYQKLAMELGVGPADFLDDGRIDPTKWYGKKLDTLRDKVRKALEA